MKFIASQVAAFIRNKTARRNFRTLLRYIGLLAGLVVVYSIVFHFLMEAEGKEHSWLTGLYWTLTVMSTLGFGDITFHSDLGRVFSIVVLMSGVIFLLIVFPFTFIHFFYQPWLQAQERIRAPARARPRVHPRPHPAARGHGPGHRRHRRPAAYARAPLRRAGRRRPARPRSRRRGRQGHGRPARRREHLGQRARRRRRRGHRRDR